MKRQTGRTWKLDPGKANYSHVYKPRFRSRVSLLTLLGVALILTLLFQPAVVRRSGTSHAHAHADTGPAQCSTCAGAAIEPQTIYAPLVDLAESSGTEINLNCRSPHAMNVTPTFYTKQGEAIVGKAFQMQAAEVKTVDLELLMPARIRGSHDLGGMTLSYTGHMLEMWAQLRLMHVHNGGSVDVVFANLSDKRSNVRNAVWTMPERSTAVIAIGNASTTAIKALLQFSNGDSQEVEVPSFGTQLIRRNSQRSGGSLNADRGADAVKVTSAGGSYLFLAGAVMSDTDRFTSSIRFYDTVNVVQQNLFATNFRLHQVRPLLVLRNTGAEDIVATPRFRSVTGDPNNFIDLAAVNLGPNAIANIDLNSQAAGTQGNADFDEVSIEVMNTGAKGSLIGALYGIDETTAMTYDVPLRDFGALRTSTGAYPWRLDGDVSTIVSITNVSPLPSEFVVQLNYPGGPYVLNPRKLPANGTAIFDLQKIRDEQIPDRLGHTIPRDLQGGQFRWFIHGADSGRLIGRAEMLSVSRQISSSYSCNDPCPPMFAGIYMDPWELDLANVNDVGGFNVTELDQDSYGNQYWVSPWIQGWTSFDTNVASVEDEGTYADVTGLAVGMADIEAVARYEMYSWDGLNCYDGGPNEGTADGEVQVAAQVYVSNVSATPMSSEANGSSTVTVQVAGNANVPSGVTVTVKLLLESKTPTSIVTTEGSGNQTHTGIAVGPGSPGSTTFTVGTDGTNATSGDLVFRASITSVSNGGVTAVGSPGGATDHVTVHVP
jgi:hypothetical protein